MRRLRTAALAATFAIAYATIPHAAAQDTRVVTEPRIPAPCAVIEARLSAVTVEGYPSLASADEARLDTGRIQAALDACAKGRSVVLRRDGGSDAFVSGPLTLRSGVALVVEGGATLFKSLDPRLFDVTPGSCGIVNTAPGPGCQPFLAATRVTGAAVMGDGVIDGRGGLPLTGGALSSWDIGQRSGPGFKRLSRMLVADGADDFTLYRITFRNSAYFNVSYSRGNGFTAWGVKIDTPRRDGKAARPLSRNTDGIDPGNGSRNVTITRSFIRVGDDNIAIKGGPGGARDMTISDNHFYWGHGMSIGSQTYGGIGNIRVTSLTIDGAGSGLRIKSAGDRGGIVRNVEYSDVCIRDTDAPIDIAAEYSGNNANKGDRAPTYRDIAVRGVRVAGGGTIRIAGYDAAHRTGITLDGIVLEPGTTPYAYRIADADIVVGSEGNLQLPAGEGVSIRRTPSTPRVPTPSCEGRFVPFPEVSTTSARSPG